MVKYPLRKDSRQRVLNIDLGLMTLRGGREVPLVVTAERERLTLYWGLQSGQWASWTRKHAPLDARPLRPDGVERMNWSRNVAIAVVKEFVVLAYKRRVDGAAAGQLVLDAFEWDGPREALIPIDAEGVPVPLEALEIEAIGADIWAGWVDSTLHVLVHAGAGSHGKPTLALLSLAAGNLSRARIEAPSNWRVRHIDGGGYDFHALRARDTLTVVHRREPAAVSASTTGIDIDQSFGLLLVDDPAAPFPQSVMEHTPLVLLVIDLQTGNVTLIDEAVPGGEHPRIQHLEPVILTANRRRVSRIEMDRDASGATMRARDVRADKVLLMRVQDAWGTAHIGGVDGTAFCLRDLLPALTMVGFDTQTLGLAALLDPHPMELVAYEHFEGKPEHRVALLHHDSRLGALVVSHFLLRELRGGTLGASEEGSGVWDINHAQIGGRPPSLTDAAENTQFTPLVGALGAAHEDGYRVTGAATYDNTIGGRVVAHARLRARFVGYVDMSDGGCRVFHESEVVIPPPLYPPSGKLLPPAAVPGPGAGSAWITIDTPDFIPTDLPGYRAGYNDFLATVLNSNGRFPPLVTLVLVVAAELGFTYFPRRSMGVGLQPAIDVLPLLSALFLGSSTVASSVTLTRADADVLQMALLGLIPTSRVFRGPAQPFAMQFTHSPGFLFTDVPYSFDAAVPGPPPPVQFEWTFSDHSGPPADAATTQTTTASGASAVHTFAAGVLTSDVTLRVTANDGQVNTMNRRVAVSDSFWGMLWQPHTLMNRDPAARLGSLRLELAKYRIDYNVTGGTQTSLVVEYLDKHDARIRCFGPPEPGQGEIGLRLPLRVHCEAVSLAGGLAWLNAAVTIRSIDVALDISKRFTPCVLTSDRRSVDPLRRLSYVELAASTAPDAAETLDVETVRENAQFPGGEMGSEPLPAALAAKPLPGMDTTVDDVKADVALSDGARTVAFVLALLTVLALAGPALIMVLVILASLEANPNIFTLAVSLALLAPILLILGLEWVLIDVVAPFLLSNYVTDLIAGSLHDRSESIGTALQSQGLLRYTGEGVAEAIAIKVIGQAVSDGHAVPPFDPAREAGRARFRPQVFETIFVSEGQCKVRIRV